MADLIDVFWSQCHWWQGARRVTGVNTGFLNVLHHATEVNIGAVAQCVNVNFDSAIQETVNQYWVLTVEFSCALDVGLQRGLVVDDFHATSAQHIGRTNENWVTNLLRDATRLGE